MQRLSKNDQYIISRDTKEVLKLWELTSLKPYQTIPDNQLDDAQKAAITGLKTIFDRWVMEVSITAKTPNSRLRKITRLRIYLKELLDFPDNPRYFRHLPFSLIKTRDDFNKINQDYMETKKMTEETIKEVKAEIIKANDAQKEYENDLIQYQARLNKFSDNLLILLERGVNKLMEVTERVQASTGDIDYELNLQNDIFTTLKNVATVSKTALELKNTSLQVSEIRQHLAKLVEEKSSDRR